MSRRFSEKLGLHASPPILQKESMDQRLRNRLWSRIDQCYFEHSKSLFEHEQFHDIVIYNVWDEFFGRSQDEISNKSSQNVLTIRDWYFEASWNEAYDLIQFFVDFLDTQNTGHRWDALRESSRVFIRQANDVLEKERSAYRFVSHELCAVTDETEMKEIEGALTGTHPFEGSRRHLKVALTHYGNREDPDYRNSIKESISAIESLLSSINEKNEGSLSKALKSAKERGLQFHPALEQGILKIYGWTSDDGGIRHALKEGDLVPGENEARLMLVMCSALFNYLVAVWFAEQSN